MNRSVERKARLLVAAVAVVLGMAALAAAAPAGDGPYRMEGTIPLGGEGRWDYVTFDPASKLLFVPRSSHTTVIDPAPGAAKRVVVDIAGTDGVHGTALAPAAGRAFTSNGKDGTIGVIDLKTLKLLGKVTAAPDVDCIIYDPASDRVLAFSGDENSCIPIAPGVDPAHGKADPAVDLGGKPEFAVSDGAGHVYVNIVDRSEIVALDTSGVKGGKPITVAHRWALAPGEHPTGLAIDPATHRLFSGCRNKTLVVMNAESGKVVAHLPIGSGVDATAFDSGYVLASCGDGTLTVAHEDGPDQFTVVQVVKTQAGARTMAVDPATHTVYLPTAEMAPARGTASGGGRPTPVDGTFRLVMVKRGAGGAQP